jgi:ferric-dicitrate binding protein FerR (iron transport regulator)
MHPGRGKLFLFSCILAGVFLLTHSGTAPGQPAKTAAAANQAEVTYLQGRAEVLAKGETAWKPLRVGSLLSMEDEGRTGEQSRIEIRLPDRSILRFDQKTTFKMKSLLFDAQEGSRDMKVEVPVGKTWANVRKAFGPKKTFEIASANAVAGVRDTIWRMNVETDQSTLIRVYEGMVEVYSPFVKPDYKPEETGFKAPREVRGPQEVPRPYQEVTKEQWEQIVLTQMMQVVVPAVGRPHAPTSFTPEEDQREEWVRWNQQRDREVRP